MNFSPVRNIFDREGHKIKADYDKIISACLT